MRPLVLVSLVCVTIALGCARPQASAREDRRHLTELLESRPAIYCNANVREYESRAVELEREVEEQTLVVQRLWVRAQDALGEADRVSRDMRLPPTVREATALNLRGEGTRMIEEAKKRRELIGILDSEASWYRGQAHREAQRMGQVFSGDIPTR
jgi:hypothetical protein